MLPSFLTSETGRLLIFPAPGPWLNVLPILTVGIFLWQQSMFMPPPTDDQSAMQQKLMKGMTIIMGIAFFKVAAGLCLYFMASSLVGDWRAEAAAENGGQRRRRRFDGRRGTPRADPRRQRQRSREAPQAARPEVERPEGRRLPRARNGDVGPGKTVSLRV